jgi:hypothetical protein
MRPRVAGWLALTVLLTLYAVVLASYFEPVLSHPDDDGYFVQAALLARHHTLSLVRTSNAQHAGSFHWLALPDGSFTSRYPFGVALVAAPVYALLGPQAALWVNPVLALVTLGALFVLVRGWTGHALWGVYAAALLACSPQFFSRAISSDAHTATACVLAATMCVLCAWHERRERLHAIAAGVLLGLIPQLHYADSLTYLGFALFVCSSASRSRTAWRQVAWMAAAASMTLLPMLVRHQLILGAFYKTAYSLNAEDTEFGLAYLRANLGPAVRGLAFGLGPSALPALVAVLVMLARPSSRRLGLWLVGMCSPTVLLYAAHYDPDLARGAPISNVVLRFTVPLLVAFFAAVAWLVAAVATRLPRSLRWVLPLALLVLQVRAGAAKIRLEGRADRLFKANIRRVADTLARLAPKHSVVLADLDLERHLAYLDAYKLADYDNCTEYAQLRDCLAMGAPVRLPSNVQVAKIQTIAAGYPGLWWQRRGQFVADVAAWRAGLPVYVVGTEVELAALSYASGARAATGAQAVGGAMPTPSVADTLTSDPDFKVLARVPIEQASGDLLAEDLQTRLLGSTAGVVRFGSFGGAREVLVVQWMATR